MLLGEIFYLVDLVISALYVWISVWRFPILFFCLVDGEHARKGNWSHCFESYAFHSKLLDELNRISGLLIWFSCVYDWKIMGKWYKINRIQYLNHKLSSKVVLLSGSFVFLLFVWWENVKKKWKRSQILNPRSFILSCWLSATWLSIRFYSIYDWMLVGNGRKGIEIKIWILNF